SFVLAQPVAGVTPEQLCQHIERATALRARTTDQFRWDCIRYYLRNTGIPVNFGITIFIALVVGTVVAGQTFQLFTVDNLRQFGELTFIVGPSGSGKTTLLSVVAGLLDHDGGSLRVLDSDMHTLTGAERLRFRRRNLGFLFQQYNLLPALSAVENVAVPLIASGVRRKTAEERAAALLATVGLG